MISSVTEDVASRAVINFSADYVAPEEFVRNYQIITQKPNRPLNQSRIQKELEDMQLL